MKLLKILAIVVGSLVLLLVVGGVLLAVFFDPNDYKPQIEQAVQNQTGRDLTIEGDIGLTVYPWLGIEIGPARLSNAEGFGEEPFAEVNAVKVRVRLLPLLERRVEADTIILDGLRLQLVRNQAGQGNWEGLVKTAEVAEREAPVPAPPGEEIPAVAGLAVNGLKVTGARIIWDDRMASNHLVISDFDLTSGSIVPGEPLDMETSFQFQNRAPALAGQVGVEGDLVIDTDAQRYAFRDAGIHFDLTGRPLPGGALKGEVELSAETDLNRQIAEIPQLAARLANIQIDARLRGERILDQPQFTGNLQVAEFNPRELMAQLGMEAPVTADPQVLKTASLSTNLEAGTNAARLNTLQIKLDDSLLGGDLQVQNFADPAINFDLNINSMDLDRYMAPPAEAEGESPQEQPVAGEPGVPVGLPVETLRGLNVKGRLNVGQLKVANLTTSQVLLQVDAQNGLVRLDPLRADLYSGQAEGKVSIDVRGKEPKLQVNKRLSGIQAEPLLRDLLEKDVLAGTGELSMNVTAQGVTAEAMQRSLDGNAAFTFTDGAIKGFNVARMIREARARLQGESLPEADVPNETDFAELKGTATITDGVIVNEDLSAKSPLLRITGQGTVNLPQEQIDYLVKTIIVGTLKGQGGRELAELQGIPIPIRISGSLADPRFAPDLQAALSEQAKQRVEQEIEEQKEELREKVEETIQEKLGEDVKEQLKGLFR